MQADWLQLRSTVKQQKRQKEKAVSNSASLSNAIPTNAYQTSKPPFLL